MSRCLLNNTCTDCILKIKATSKSWFVTQKVEKGSESLAILNKIWKNFKASKDLYLFL